MCYQVKTAERSNGDPPEKNCLFEAVEGHWNRSATYDSYYCSIVITGLSHTIFKISNDFGRKSQISPPGVFNAPGEGVSFGTLKKR